MRPWVKELVESVEPFEVTSSGDLYSAPPVDYLVEGIIPLYSVVGLTGFPGTGKTWFAMEMMRAVATGTKFLGKFPVRRAPVLFVGNDASLLDYATQWKRLTFESYLAYNQSRAEGLVNLNPFDTMVHFLIQSAFSLDDTEQVARLIRTSQDVLSDPEFDVVTDVEGQQTLEQTTKQNFGLIVLDTLSKMTRSSEIDNTARDAVFENIRLIAESTGATILLIHHNAMVSEFRTGEEWRGGGSQFASLDCHFHLTTKNKQMVEFKTKKMRGLTPPTFYFDLNVQNPGPASLDYNNLTDVQADQQERLLDDLVRILRENDNAPTTLSDFALKLLALYTDKFNDLKALTTHIRHILYQHVREPNPRIIVAVPGAGRRPALYKLAFTEGVEDENRGYPTSDSQGTGESGTDSSGMAEESAETGGDHC